MKAFVNGTFVSCEEENQVFACMVEEKGKILWLGNQLPERFANVPTVDMNGAAVVPAFADTHIHFESFALFHNTVDVRDAKDMADTGRILRAYADTHPNDKVIPAYGCTAHIVAEKRLVTRVDLDGMVSRPLMIIKYDGHAAVCNSALLQLFPSDVTSDPGCDMETGWLYQNAFYKGTNFITGQIPVPRVLRGLVEASNHMTRMGVGLIHTVEGVGYAGDIDVDMMRACRYGLPQTFRIFFQTMDVSKATKRHMRHIGGCFKLALDGCFGSEDAALSDGYANNPDNHGFLAYSQQQVNAFCLAANRAELQIAMHAIGDAAVEQAIVGLEAAQSDYPRPDARHIIIHADLCKPEHRRRIKALGACIALQPAFLDWPQEPASYLESILGKERADAIEPLRSLTDDGILLSAGSDGPCTLPDPIASIHISCNHPNPAQSLTPLEALRMHTLNAAKTTHDEAERGSLTVGKRCDFTVLAQNPLTMEKTKLKDNHVLALYMEGREVKPMVCGTPGLLWRSLIGKLQGKD